MTVHILNFKFDTSPTIHPGDTVHWVWDNGGHSTTSVVVPGQTESWDSKIQSAPFTFDHTFTAVGTFNYYCTVHGFDAGGGNVGGMSGHVVAQAAACTLAVTNTADSGPGFFR